MESTSDPKMDVENLAIQFSHLFHKEGLSPEFYVCIKRPGLWEIYDTEEPCKELNDFLRACRLPLWMKKRYYYKGERANQHLVVTEILGHFMFRHKDEIHFRGDLIDKISIQWATMTGHTVPYDKEEERYLMKNKLPVSLLLLTTKMGKNIYIDLCGPQLDVHNYASGDKKRGYDDPIYMTNTIKRGKLYAPDLDKSVKVISIEDPITIDEDHYRKYLDLLIEEDDDDRAEYLIEYHERLEGDFEKLVKEQKVVDLPHISKNYYIN